MATLTLWVWRDTGYTEGCLEVPSKTSSLPSPAFTFTDLHPTRDKLFSETQVPQAYEDLYDCSYVRASLDMNNGDDVTVYGWIDTVTASSDTAGSPMTVIRWHIDYWRTYLGKAVFKGGVVKRRRLGSSTAIPVQPYPYRYKEYVDRYDVMIPSDIWWVVFNYNDITTEVTPGTTTSTSTTTRVSAGETETTQSTSTTNPSVTTTESRVRWGCYPVSKNNPSTSLSIGSGASCPSLNDTLTIGFDELFGLDPQAINSAFLSPVSPNSYGSGYSMTGWSVSSSICNGKCFYATSLSAFGQSFERSLNNSTKPIDAATTTDTESFTLTDPMGYACGTLPWGITVTYLRYWLVVSTETCYIRIMFARNSSQTLQSAVSEGLVFTSSCIPIPITSNAFSSYVYSGARETEREQRRLATEQTRDNGIAGTANSAISGAVSGAMMGGVGGPMGMLAGALLGGVGSAASSGLSTAAEYAIGLKYNDKFNDLADYSYSHQTSVNLLPGGTFDILRNDIEGYWLVKTKTDDYSQSQRTSDITMYGVHVDEPMTSTQSLINTGGPLQIVNQTVTGPIPVQAKQYFRERLAGGVRIV